MTPVKFLTIILIFLVAIFIIGIVTQKDPILEFIKGSTDVCIVSLTDGPPRYYNGADSNGRQIKIMTLNKKDYDQFKLRTP